MVQPSPFARKRARSGGIYIRAIVAKVAENTGFYSSENMPWLSVEAGLQLLRGGRTASKRGIGKMRRTCSPRFRVGRPGCPTPFQRECGALWLKHFLLRSSGDLLVITNSLGMFSGFWKYRHGRIFRTMIDLATSSAQIRMESVCIRISAHVD